jgi:hypothetical protein
LVCLADVSGEDLNEALLCGARARGQKLSDCVVDGIRSGVNGNGLRGRIAYVDVAVLKVDGAVLAQGVASHDLFFH